MKNIGYFQIYEVDNNTIYDIASYDVNGVYPKWDGLVIVGYEYASDKAEEPCGAYVLNEKGEIISTFDGELPEGLLAEDDTLTGAIDELQDMLDKQAEWKCWSGSVLDGDPDEWECIGINEW